MPQDLAEEMHQNSLEMRDMSSLEPSSEMSMLSSTERAPRKRGRKETRLEQYKIKSERKIAGWEARRSRPDITETERLKLQN